jgi:TolB-like protein/tetratricopeptide (TPR) repeat protein
MAAQGIHSRPAQDQEARMGPDSAEPASTPPGAVFLSYASQDAEAAQRICAALRSAGVEVWFDQSELRGGDAWDRQIRERIHDCPLFIALISAHTEARDEGYFRHEWKLAVERTHHMSDNKPFLVPIVIDDTRERGASVPDKLHEVQWTHLPGGETPPEFVERVRRLVSPEPHNAQTATVLPAGAARAPPQSMRGPVSRQSKWALRVIAAAVVAGALVYFTIDRFWISKHPPLQLTARAAQASAAPIAFGPPPHSIAVLPFVNMSGDKEEEYFSDGLSEELLNDLARIDGLQVAARTSAFSFKGKDTDIGTIARKLNVGTVLEGSVRRSKNTVRITAQLINAVTGFHLWSQTYDRTLGDLLKLQADIAEAVASTLKVKLLGDAVTEMKIGGTRNPAAYDAYLRSASAYWQVVSASDNVSVRAGYQEAVRLDPNFAQAYAELSIALGAYATLFAHGPAVGDYIRQAQAPALKAVALAPELAEGHLALAVVREDSLDFAGTSDEFQRAMTLAPGNARVLRDYGAFAVQMGRTDAGIAAARRAAALDPLNEKSHSFLSDALLSARRYDEALAAYQNALSLRPNDPQLRAFGHLIYYALGDFEKMRAACEGVREAVKDLQVCLPLAYHKLGRQVDAETALARFQALEGNTGAYGYATIYAQWGNTPKALEWLDTALQLRDPQLINLKTDPLLDPLRLEPRFKAIERDLKFPP